jgi:hypothetical protein
MIFTEKDELMRTLINAKELEETHSSVITKFFLESFDWTGYDSAKVSIVKKILASIDKQTEKHAEMIGEMIETLGRMDKYDI